MDMFINPCDYILWVRTWALPAQSREHVCLYQSDLSRSVISTDCPGNRTVEVCVNGAGRSLKKKSARDATNCLVTRIYTRITHS